MRRNSHATPPSVKNCAPPTESVAPSGGGVGWGKVRGARHPAGFLAVTGTFVGASEVLWRDRAANTGCARTDFGRHVARLRADAAEAHRATLLSRPRHSSRVRPSRYARGDVLARARSRAGAPCATPVALL